MKKNKEITDIEIKGSQKIRTNIIPNTKKQSTNNNNKGLKTWFTKRSGSSLMFRRSIDELFSIKNVNFLLRYVLNKFFESFALRLYEKEFKYIVKKVKYIDFKK